MQVKNLSNTEFSGVLYRVKKLKARKKAASRRRMSTGWNADNYSPKEVCVNVRQNQQRRDNLFSNFFEGILNMFCPRS